MTAPITAILARAVGRPVKYVLSRAEDLRASVPSPQAVFQFMPRWRVGARYDSLDSGDVAIGLVTNGTLTAADFPVLAPHDPKRISVMVDFAPSEFSRLRLQFARDESRFHDKDSQIVLQYIMSLGAHGAHKF